MKKSSIMFSGLFLSALSLSAGDLLAGPDTVALSGNYKADFVNYLDVDRIDRKRVRKMYVNPAALEAAKADEPLPNGTVLIMENHDAKVDADGNLMRDVFGRLIAATETGNRFVMEKNEAWSTENEHWDYAWYGADGKPSTSKFATTMDGCFACHANREERDYTFTFSKYLIDLKN